MFNDVGDGDFCDAKVTGKPPASKTVPDGRDDLGGKFIGLWTLSWLPSQLNPYRILASQTLEFAAAGFVPNKLLINKGSPEFQDAAIWSSACARRFLIRQLTRP